MKTTKTPKIPAAMLLFMLVAGTTQALSVDTTDLGMALDADLEPEPMLIPVEEYIDALKEQEAHGGVRPQHLDHDSLRPGQRILVERSDGTFICTLSFLFYDTTPGITKYYAGTAGHCLLPAGVDTTHVNGAMVYNPSGVTVTACNNTCLLGGQLSGVFWDSKTVGTVVYARQNDPNPTFPCTPGEIGNDFGLIEIDPTWYDSTAPGDFDMDPEMAVWHGPHGQGGAEGTGAVVVHYGNGITWGTTFATSARVGITLEDGDPCSWQALINIAGGDSGSAISFAQVSAIPPALSGDAALGTITHGIVGVGTPGYGTLLWRGIQLASLDAGIGIALLQP